MIEVLFPSLDLLTQDFVLIQAWKKTSAYIRNHNWYADTLELDRTAVDLPRFLAGLRESLQNPTEWSNDELRIVPAPKSQRWRVSPDGQQWRPVEEDVTSKLRPLAHVSLRSQVVATAVMMCVADRVETRQGDPRGSYTSYADRQAVISYGNRLFCDSQGLALTHRWGSSKLYRAYFQDYRTFLTRADVVAESSAQDGSNRHVVVHSDLSRFYDRVRPSLLNAKLDELLGPDANQGFRELAERALSWSWSERDRVEVGDYERKTGIHGFSHIALPQGLVSAGFFANLVLLDFDDLLRRSIGSTEVFPGGVVVDVVRYVDDLRIILTVESGIPLEKIEEEVTIWLQGLLDRSATGLVVSNEKTHAFALSGEQKPLVRQSRKMARIQGAISGGFDTVGGVEILDAVQGLIRSQQRYSETQTSSRNWSLAPVPDVRDATVARFAAGRYRATYRSLRPMLLEQPDDPTAGLQYRDEETGLREQRTKRELDEEAKAFALGLIEAWLDDPANVRLLRIGLDLWPSKDVLTNVLFLLKPFTTKGGPRGAPRRVAWYCLSEIFRAGATETGYVQSDESMPEGIDIEQYRLALEREAVRLMEQKAVILPWYLKQQLLLYLATRRKPGLLTIRRGGHSETKYYRELLLFKEGRFLPTSSREFAILAVLSYRSFGDDLQAIDRIAKHATPRLMAEVVERDMTLALEVYRQQPSVQSLLGQRQLDDLCLSMRPIRPEMKNLVDVVGVGPNDGPLRNEFSVLSFASSLLNAIERHDNEVIIPINVYLGVDDVRQPWRIKQVHLARSVTSAESLYSPPKWCPIGERWRFQLGFLLRYVLTARCDFTQAVRSRSWRSLAGTYIPAPGHAYQRIHGLFSGHESFGDGWLPISEWIEKLLMALLRWPGCRVPSEFSFVERGLEATRLALGVRQLELRSIRGVDDDLLILPMSAPALARDGAVRPLRACVVQTIFPSDQDFSLNDLKCDHEVTRKKHRRHISAALAAVERMLDLRETHLGKEGRLDWLILPELAVHPNDVSTHLIPFARAHKTIILAGLTYQELLKGKPLVNSALWIIPVTSKSHGLQMRIRLQGKKNLSPQERQLNVGTPLLQGFRPCQWLIGYEFGEVSSGPLWLTGSICYDATDLSLASDLRNVSDVYAIPALNRDVGTFDQMSLALHYHMFQMIIIANNGLYGGSNAYAPYKESFKRQIFHMHGQPQASVAFLEIDPVALFKLRKDHESQSDVWKSPPAGVA
ncbi:hypothetical protein RKE25_02130 [Dyella sp. BiH032]|uniref:hypothetical protein n=1 Tax=Dyella sp. BiH032 TaxID=3075430 RepID=UPI002892D211|nr:hypothetical protein [Dyella sp. BiH032]WNL46456.1 hypothetical protein RKE25_02130 [Dyella sp. BiH032]